MSKENFELSNKISEIDEQIKEVKSLIEKEITPNLSSYMMRTKQIEDFMEHLSQQFNQSNRLTITQTEELVKALDKVKNEIKDQTNQNQNLIKKSAPVVALLTVLASIALEIFKYMLK